MKKFYAPALLALACGSALAAPGNSKLEEIIVTSSRVAMPLRLVGASVSVLNQQDIVERGFSNLADILRWEPAISVSNTGGPGKATSLRIRGENGYRTKVYLDGIDITDTSSPQAGPHFEQLTSAGTERVEILRGPQGMMYGADAGGVVYGTEGPFLSALGMDVVILGPGSIDQAHQPDEFLELDGLRSGVAVLREMIRRFCGRA